MDTDKIIDLSSPDIPFVIVDDFSDENYPWENFFWQDDEYEARFEEAKNNAFLKTVIDVSRE